MGAIADALEESLTAATHLTGTDKAAVQTLRTLAAKIDDDELRWQYVLEYAESRDLKPPAPDNVSIPTLLKFCESLGLTPAGRTKLGEKKPEAPGGKLALLRNEAQNKRGTKAS